MILSEGDVIQTQKFIEIDFTYFDLFAYNRDITLNLLS